MKMETFRTKRTELAFSFLGLILLVSLPVWEWIPTRGWHDRQRMGQVFLILLSAVAGLWLGVFKKSPKFLERQIQYAIVIVAILGLISVALARQPIWALMEWSIFVGCLCMGWMVVFIHQRFRAQESDRLLLGTVFFVTALLSLKFISHYIIFILQGDKLLDVWWLIDGFDNPRFFGQFCSLTLPLMAIPLLEKESLGRFNKLGIWVLVLWWAQAIASGTRGTWLGMAGAMAVLACLGPLGRRWAMAQCMGIAGGWMLFSILLVWLPNLLDVEVMNAAGSRLTTSLSARETIWQQALEMIAQKPWLGFGPMHFADISNPIAAHPHQAILQWASEWGIPSVLLVCAVAGYGFLGIFCRIKKKILHSDRESIIYVCLSASILSSLLQSMVDGVFVMPYTELWLTLNIAWLMALHQRNIEAGRDYLCKPAAYTCSAVFVAAALLLLLAVIRYQPESVPPQQGSEHFQPRFWLQGVIAFKKP